MSVAADVSVSMATATAVYSIYISESGSESGLAFSGSVWVGGRRSISMCACRALYFSAFALFIYDFFFLPAFWMNESCTSAANKWMNEWVSEQVNEWVGGSYKNVANGSTKRCILKYLARRGRTPLRMLNICNSLHCRERKLVKCRRQIE